MTCFPSLLWCGLLLATSASPAGQPDEKPLPPELVFSVKTWEGDYLVDPSTSETQKYLTDLFKTMHGWGFEYFKIDGQPIVAREFRNKKASMRNPHPGRRSQRVVSRALRNLCF